MTAVLGLDVGGTTTRAWLAVGGETRRASGPSASLAAAGRSTAARVLADLLAQLGLDGSRRLDAICVGTAGSGAGDAVGWVVGRLSHLVAPPAGERVSVVNDSRLVLAAEQLDSGIALIAGTGSTAIGLLGPAEERAGGWGYLLGDDGSGYWVTREAVRELCARHDEHRPAGRLGEVLLGATGAPDALGLIQLFHEEPAPARWAALAPAVLDCGDEAAGPLRERAAAALATLVVEVAARLGHPDPVPVVAAGGLLAHHRPLAEATLSAIAGRLPGAGGRLATRPPVAGAVVLASALAERLSATA